jgi:hypothetical protein
MSMKKKNVVDGQASFLLSGPEVPHFGSTNAVRKEERKTRERRSSSTGSNGKRTGSSGSGSEWSLLAFSPKLSGIFPRTMTREEFEQQREQLQKIDDENTHLISIIQELGRQVDHSIKEGLISAKRLREKLEELDGDIQFAETVILQRLHDVEDVPPALDPIGISTRANGPADANKKLKLALEEWEYRLLVVKKRLSTESEILEQLVNQKQSELDAMPDRIDTMVSDLNRYDISIES